VEEVLFNLLISEEEPWSASCELDMFHSKIMVDLGFEDQLLPCRFLNRFL
jgi:hypothetical protein